MADAHLRWLAAWRQAVGASPAAVALVDLASVRFLEASSSAAELLGSSDHSVPFDHEALARLQRSGVRSVRISADAVPQGGRAQRLRRRSERVAETTAWARSASTLCSSVSTARSASSVRAQWAARPFVWQPYPQAEDAHRLKLDCA